MKPKYTKPKYTKEELYELEHNSNSETKFDPKRIPFWTWVKWGFAG